MRQRTYRAALVAVSAALALLTIPHAADAAPSPATSPPRPTTAAQAGQQLSDMGRRLEVVTEQYKVAASELTKRQRQAAASRAQATRLHKQVVVLQGQVKQVAVSAYQGGRLASFSTFVTSKTPTGFLDRLATLDALSQRQGATLDGLISAKHNADQATQRAAAAEADAHRRATALNAQKVAITKQVASLKQVQQTLSAKELRAWQQQQAAATVTAARRVAHHVPPVAHADQDTHDQTTQDQAHQDQTTQDQAPDDQSTDPTAPNTGPVPPTSAKAKIAVAAAEAQVGKPYVWGGHGPDVFDCSGLTAWAWAKAGVTLPTSSSQQYTFGTHVSHDQLRPGDLVFYYSPISHVAIYVGNGMIFQASTEGRPLGYASVDSAPYAGATRLG